MSARLLHGVLLGALMVAVSAFLELGSVLADFPYHRDRGLAWTWLPLHLAAGAVLGAAAALLLPLFDRRRQRDDQAGLPLAALILAGGFGAVLVLDRRLAGLGGAAVQLLVAGLLALLAWLVLARLARSRFAWVASGFTTPWFACLGLTLVVLGAGLTAWAGPAPARSAQRLDVARGFTGGSGDRPPNVLLVVLDTVAAGHLGSYGYHRPTSPALDALAAESVVFERAFAAAPWTLPSHASLFTGLHPQTHGTGWEHPRLNDGKAQVGRVLQYDALTLAEELGRRGYQTCGVSEKSWLTDRHGLTQGFEHYVDYSIASASERLLLVRSLDSIAQRLGLGTVLSSRGGDKGGARIVDTALAWLHGGRDRSRPFLLFLNLNEAHAPYLPPAGMPDFGRFLPPGATVEDLPEGYFAHAHDRKAFNSGARPLLEDESVIQRALYDASILYQDGLLARLFDGLRDAGLMEDTLVVVTSDHGEEFGEHGRFGHQFSLNDRLLHVPLLARLPRALPAGTRIAEPVSLVDVFPTVLGLVEESQGTPERKPRELGALEGFDLVPWVRGEAPSPRDWVVAHYDNPAGYLAGFPNFATDGSFPLAGTAMRSITMVRHGSRKYFRFGDGTEAFLDLATDPSERAAEPPPRVDDEAGDARRFARALAQLAHLFRVRHELVAGHLAGLGGQGGAARDDTHDPQSQRLEQLGYLGDRAAGGDAAPPPLPGRIFER